MESFMGWQASSAEIKQHEDAFNKEKKDGKVSTITQFNYACFLIQSRFPGDVRRGIRLLEELYQNPDETSKRDFVFFLALGNARLKEYNTALQYLDGMLAVEPQNSQATELKAQISKRLKDEAVKGAVIGGGVLVGLGALVGLGIALAKK